MARKTLHPSHVPPDNPDLRDHILDEYLPQLSLNDLEAVDHAIEARWLALTQVQRRAILNAHYAHLRTLPVGTLLQIAVTGTEDFLSGKSVTIIERPLRAPSPYIRVRDVHGKSWHVPMEWFVSEAEDEAMRTFLRREAEGHSLERRRQALVGVSQ